MNRAIVLVLSVLLAAILALALLGCPPRNDGRPAATNAVDT